MLNFCNTQVERFSHAIRGIIHPLRNDKSFQIQFFVGGFFVFSFLKLMAPLRDIETGLLLLSWVLILITELQNTSFETALNKIHPDKHDAIGKSKDMAAGSVLIAGVFAFFVVIWILASHT